MAYYLQLAYYLLNFRANHDCDGVAELLGLLLDNIGHGHGSEKFLDNFKGKPEIGALPAAQDHFDLDFAGFLQKFLGLAGFESEIVAADTDREADAFNLDFLLLFPLLLDGLVLLVAVLIVTQDLDHRRTGFGTDLNEIESLRLGQIERLGNRHHPKHFSFSVNDAHFGCSDPFVCPNLLVLRRNREKLIELTELIITKS
jgi:hypothetical protein